MGKSAQFPLLTWLPDAMEGPTPVSALLHSATMVAAGVYMFARIFPFFSHSADAMTVCLSIGTITMLLSSTMAMVTRDIKQVWAYSTISQLGFMVMGLAAGGYAAGVFHLTTHAGFKALLFLCSGVFIHHFETNDMFVIGRHGGRGLLIPMVCMSLAAAALSGLPPFSGFFSKEAIMGVLAGQHNPIWLAAGLLGAFLTAYYSFRLIFIILRPNPIEKVHAETHAGHGNGHHAAGLYWVMAWPLIILGRRHAGAGFLPGPVGGFSRAVTHRFRKPRRRSPRLVADCGRRPGNGRNGFGVVGIRAQRCPPGGFRGAGSGAARSLRQSLVPGPFVSALPGLRDLWDLLQPVHAQRPPRDRRRHRRHVPGHDRQRPSALFVQSGMLQYNLMVMFAALALVGLGFYFLG